MAREITQLFWVMGEFTRGGLSPDDEMVYEWRMDFIRDFLERDILSLKPRIPPPRLRQLWTMLAHSHGQLLNMPAMAISMGLNGKTIRSYIDLLEGAFMVRRLPPYSVKLKKRLVKAPKTYLRDAGILHCLLGITNGNDLFGHPVYGASQEGLCLENILPRCRRSVSFSFFRTIRGAEIDLILEKGNEKTAVEFKANSAPKPQIGFWTALEDLRIDRAWVIAPVDQIYPMRHAQVAPLEAFRDSPENEDFIGPPM